MSDPQNDLRDAFGPQKGGSSPSFASTPQKLLLIVVHRTAVNWNCISKMLASKNFKETKRNRATVKLRIYAAYM